MLKIAQRTCRLGTKYAGKKDIQEIDAEFLTLKVELFNIVMSAEELNALLAHPHAFERLFEIDENGVAAPALNGIRPIELLEEWEGASVVLWYDFGKSKVELKRATLSKLRVLLRHGGEAWLSCSVEGEPVLDRKFVDLVGCMGEAIECEIHAARPSDQKELPINSHDNGNPVPVPVKREGTH